MRRAELIMAVVLGIFSAYHSSHSSCSPQSCEQLGITGTNMMPSPLAWRSWLADHRLGALLQKDLADERRRDRFRAGAIVPDEGTTLLVDYGPLGDDVARHLAGHAVYTSKQWLLFHAEQIARRLYGQESTDE